MLKQLLLTGLRVFAAAVARLPKNKTFYGYTISLQGSPYITRVIFPRVFGRRLMLHQIHREDRDAHGHNHPWKKSYSLILTGGYIERRVITGAAITNVDELEETERELRPGMINVIDREDFHRIVYVKPGTWSLFLAGERVGGWGFLVAPGCYVEHDVYATVGGRPVEPGVGA